MGKVLGTIGIVIAVLFGLWLLGGLFSIVGAIFGLIMGIFGLILNLLFSKAFWILLTIGVVVYYLSRRNGNEEEAHVSDTSSAIQDPENRLDRLNQVI